MRLRPGRVLASLAALALTSCDGPSDFLLRAVWLGATSVRPGDPLPVTAQVCNNLAVMEGSPFLELWLGPEDGGPEHPLGGHPVADVPPGDCREEAFEFAVPHFLPDGAYRVFGVLDPLHEVPDANPHNNAAESPLVGVGYGPDLVVAGVAGPPNVEPGAPLPLEAEVCNQGTDPSFPVDVVFYLSEDDVLESAAEGPPGPDLPLGPAPVPGLAPGQCTDVAELLPPGAPAGLWHVAARVDDGDFQAELIESNNGHLGGLLGVGHGPDLVGSVTGPPSTAGGAFELAASVCNQGTGPSPPGLLEVWLTRDGAVDPTPGSGDWPAGGLSTPPLAPGECFADVVGGVAPLSPMGRWLLGGVVDPPDDVAELQEGNNVFTGDPIGVGLAADLVVTSIAGPPSATTTDPFDVSVRVCNQGTEPSPPQAAWIHLSEDAVLDPMPLHPPHPPHESDPAIGELPVPPLAPGECHEETGPMSGVPVEGAWHLAARADAWNGVPELIETNNGLVGGLIGLGHLPDLVLTGVAGPPSAEPYASFEATARVCNQGQAPSSPTHVVFHHTQDGEIEALPYGPGPGVDPVAGVLDVPPLVEGSCASVSGLLFPATPEGAWRLGARVDEDDLVGELIEVNNDFVGGWMGIGFGPDLVVTALAGPPSAMPGDPLTLAFEVCNQGTAGSPPALVEFFGTADDVVTGHFDPPLPPDPFLGHADLPPLPAGACVAGEASGGVPSALSGEARLAALVDAPDAVSELIEANNALLGDAIGIGFGPDFVVASLAGPPSAAPPGSFPVDVEVCNQGTAVGGTPLALYLSQDEQVEGSYFGPGEDVLVADAFVSPLGPGDCAVVPLLPGLPPLAEGPWFLAAIVDEGQHELELIESNNEHLGPRIGIGFGADLVVSSLAAPASAPLWTDFPVDAEVCNLGTMASPPIDVALYLSEDALIEGGPPGPDLPLGVAPVPPLAPSECTLVGTLASPPAPGSWHLGAIVDEFEYVPELIEDNNVHVDAVIDVTP